MPLAIDQHHPNILMKEMRKSSFSRLSPALVHLIAGGKHARPEEEHLRNVHETFSLWCSLTDWATAMKSRRSKVVQESFSLWVCLLQFSAGSCSSQWRTLDCPEVQVVVCSGNETSFSRSSGISNGGMTDRQLLHLPAP